MKPSSAIRDRKNVNLFKIGSLFYHQPLEFEILFFGHSSLVSFYSFYTAFFIPSFSLFYLSCFWFTLFGVSITEFISLFIVWTIFHAFTCISILSYLSFDDPFISSVVPPYYLSFSYLSHRTKVVASLSFISFMFCKIIKIYIQFQLLLLRVSKNICHYLFTENDTLVIIINDYFKKRIPM